MAICVGVGDAVRNPAGVGVVEGVGVGVEYPIGVGVGVAGD